MLLNTVSKQVQRTTTRSTSCGERSWNANFNWSISIIIKIRCSCSQPLKPIARRTEPLVDILFLQYYCQSNNSGDLTFTMWTTGTSYVTSPQLYLTCTWLHICIMGDCVSFTWPHLCIVHSIALSAQVKMTSRWYHVEAFYSRILEWTWQCIVWSPETNGILSLIRSSGSRFELSMIRRSCRRESLR